MEISIKLFQDLISAQSGLVSLKRQATVSADEDVGGVPSSLLGGAETGMNTREPNGGS